MSQLKKERICYTALLFLLVAAIFLFQPGNISSSSPLWGIDRGFDYLRIQLNFSPSSRVNQALKVSKERFSELKGGGAEKVFPAYEGTTEILRQSVGVLPSDIKKEKFVKLEKKVIEFRDTIERSAPYLWRKGASLDQIFDIVDRMRAVMTAIEDKKDRIGVGVNLERRFGVNIKKSAKENLQSLKKINDSFFQDHPTLFNILRRAKEAYNNQDFADSRRISEDLMIKLLPYSEVSY